MPRPKNEDFTANYVVNPETNCWEWIGAKYAKGYGAFTIDGTQFGAHVAAYIIYYGKIPDGLEVDYTCRNRKCVNPEHLEAVTRKQNVRRGAACIELSNNKQMQDEVRRLYSTGLYSIRKLAQVFNCGKTMIWNLVAKKGPYSETT